LHKLILASLEFLRTQLAVCFFDALPPARERVKEFRTFSNRPVATRVVFGLLIGLPLLTPNSLNAQSTPEQLAPILSRRVQASGIVEFQLRQYLRSRVPPLQAPATQQEWTAQAKRLRQHLLGDVVFHGWPKEWVDAPLKAEDLGFIESGQGYRIRKLRYEIVPGFQSTAILYEPTELSRKVPAILNVNGHAGPGKAVEYKQKRCINYARQGMLALSLEWPGFGELSQPENSHDFGAHLDLVGCNGLGFFYLAMRKGLDYLYEHPNADRNRIGMTGLSGGGWQTIVLSALDERVAVAIPVAGYGSLESDAAHPQDTSEIEEDATDFRYAQDYTHLTAMRAPRPTLLVFNAEDDCCFRAPLVKPFLYEEVKPFFKLYGKEDAFAWHENADPGTHNYQLDNRLQSYSFFSRFFGLSEIKQEVPVDAEIKSYGELAVGLPKDNLTILGLARKLAADIQRPGMPTEASAKSSWMASQRTRLKSVVRYAPVVVKEVWMLANSKNKGVESRSYRFEFSNGLSATGTWVKAITTSDQAPATLMIHDQGKKELSGSVSDRINRGEQVLALDLLFSGDESPESPTPADYAFLLASTGNRPIGMEAAQLTGAASWLKELSGVRRLRLESVGLRSQLAALVGSALEPDLFSQVIIQQGMQSLNHLLNAPVKYRAAADLFCLDLYRDFDIDLLAALAEPAKVAQSYQEASPKSN
jgi:dienelactone hydrolase